MNRIVLALMAALVALPAGATMNDDEVTALRARGQAAVDELADRLRNADADETMPLTALLDRVCAQKDCQASRLFWFTDLEEAKNAAHRTGRPILALYLLGRLDEELSCANSRFFRTILYPDDAISATLRDEYVLYWHSVRPVPRVTIDLGDGRTIRQTITGNSIHYLLSEDGSVLDALPGLYSPGAFHDHLQQWLSLYRSLGGLGAGERANVERRYHQEQSVAEEREAASLGIPLTSWNGITNLTVTANAYSAAPLAETKMITEVPVLRQLTPAEARRIPPADPWRRIGLKLMDDVVFSPAAIELIARKQFGSARPSPEERNRLFVRLRLSVAADSAFNELELHYQIHGWLGVDQIDLEILNERVYRELFRTPLDDPWMGLRPEGVFTAIAE